MDNKPTIEFDAAELELIPDDEDEAGFTVDELKEMGVEDDAPDLVLDLADEVKDISTDPELEMEIVPLPKPLFYMEYTRPSELGRETNAGKFHSDYIKLFVRQLRDKGIIILLLRRESDKKILINAPTEPMARV